MEYLTVIGLALSAVVFVVQFICYKTGKSK